jgi:hypothetical protein
VAGRTRVEPEAVASPPESAEGRMIGIVASVAKALVCVLIAVWTLALFLAPAASGAWNLIMRRVIRDA